MEPLKWSFCIMCLWFKVIESGASSWSAQVPSTVKGLVGSCVVIPCSFNYPDPGKKVTGFTGIWTDETSHIAYHPVASKMLQQYRKRTALVGDIRHKNCSLKIEPLQQSDHGPFHFRIEITDYDQYSYRENKVSISLISIPNAIKFSMKEDIREGQAASASCSVSHSCPTSPPVFTWSHSGEKSLQSHQIDDGQWELTSTLTFHPTSADHLKPLQCNVMYKGGQHQETSRILHVKYAPVNVKVDDQKEVKEGDAVHLTCSSDANPPVSSYEWHNGTSARLHKGQTIMLPHVSRHIGEAFYCVAHNEIGEAQSSPVHLNVLYAPEIKTASSCYSEGNMVKCECIVESKPPSMVHFVVADRVLQSTKVESNSSLTVCTMTTDFGSFESVNCLANNTQGHANFKLSLLDNIEMLNVFIAIGVTVIILVMILIAVGVVKKCRRKPRATPACDMNTVKANEAVALPHYATTKRMETFNSSDIYANAHIYSNLGDDRNEAIYANV